VNYMTSCGRRHMIFVLKKPQIHESANEARANRRYLSETLVAVLALVSEVALVAQVPD